MPKPLPSFKQASPWLLIILIFSILSFLSISRLRHQFLSSQLSDPSSDYSNPSPLPTPKPLPTGSQTYNISHGESVVGPKPTKATINPLDPKIGDTQTLTIQVSHDKPVTKASITLLTDNAKQELPLQLISGTTSEGVWQASWTMEDSYDYSYQTDFHFFDGAEEFTGGLAFR